MQFRHASYASDEEKVLYGGESIEKQRIDGWCVLRMLVAFQPRSMRANVALPGHVGVQQGEASACRRLSLAHRINVAHS